MLTPYPQIVEYNEAVQHPATAFRDPELRRGKVKVNALGLPIALSGGFALTYMMATPRRRLAVRCFHRDIPRAQHKYAAIARAVGALKSSYFVGFEYLPDGIAIRGGFYPVLKMDWVEGDPLGIWLDRNSGNPRALAKLRGAFAALAGFLEQHGIAHGDIQNGNVIISPTGLKLVDYDGVFVPGMPADFASETGHKHFQHPGRTLPQFGPTIDRFSFLAVDLSLAALIEDPSLHRRFRQGGETILFRANDFADPERSEVFGILRQRGTLRPMVQNFAAICRADIGAVPPLADFLAGRNIPGAGAAAASVMAPSAAKPRATQHIGSCPVLRADDFSAFEQCVGQRVELIGQVRGIRRGLGERGNRRGKPFVLLEFAAPRRDGVRVTIWGDNLAQPGGAPDESWAGRWVSIVGLVEPPVTERHFWSSQTCIDVSTENPHEIEFVAEDEARFRLSRGGSAAAPATATPVAAPRRAAPGGPNRRLIAHLTNGSTPPPPPIAAAAAQPASRWQPSRSNRAILQTLQPTPTRPAPAAPTRPPADTSRRTAPRSTLPKSGSVVLHPRGRTTPPQPVVSSPAAPTPWRRILRVLGVDS